MYPIVNPYRDKERLANTDGNFVGKSKKGTPHWSSRSLLILVLLVITGVVYYMHHVHNAHLLVNDKSYIRGSAGSFSQSVMEPGDVTNNDVENSNGRGKNEVPPPVKDLRKKDDPSVVRSGKISSFNPQNKDKNDRVDAPYSPELMHKLQAQSMDAGAIEDKVIALAAFTRQNEQKVALERAEREQEAAREAQRVAEEAALAAERERTIKLIADRRAAQVAADQKAVQLEAERKFLEEKRGAQVDADRLAAQMEADALLAKRADEERQAAVRAQEEETMRAAEAAAAVNHQEAPLEPVGVLAPPAEPEPLKPDLSVPSAPQQPAQQPPQDGPIGVLAPPAEPEPEPVVQNPPVAAGDVLPVVNVDPAEHEHTVEEAAHLMAAAMAAEKNLGHPDVPPEEEHHELPPPDNPGVLTPPDAQLQVPDLAVEGAPVLDHPVVALSPPDQAVIPAEPAIPEPAQPALQAPPQEVPNNEPTPPERPMGFDLPPDKILKMAAAPVVVVPSGEKIDYCAGNVDPFAAQSVELFQPPATADFELVSQWRSAVSAMIKRISKVKFGGEELRELIRGEVETLKVMRFKMFCKYA